MQAGGGCIVACEKDAESRFISFMDPDLTQSCYVMHEIAGALLTPGSLGGAPPVQACAMFSSAQVAPVHACAMFSSAQVAPEHACPAFYLVFTCFLGATVASSSAPNPPNAPTPL